LPGRLFLEGKALELLALQMGWMAEGGKPSGRRTLLSPDQRERIHAAREILLRDPASPPTLPQLARRVGLGVNKLVGGFRELFGTTVYGQLQEHRMQQARLLFEQGELNVSQVAWSVGYTNISHFSAAYKKRFGVLPKTFLQSARRRNLAD
jgi:AraC-like DNA-binding protein